MINNCTASYSGVSLWVQSAVKPEVQLRVQKAVDGVHRCCVCFVGFEQLTLPCAVATDYILKWFAARDKQIFFKNNSETPPGCLELLAWLVGFWPVSVGEACHIAPDSSVFSILIQWSLKIFIFSKSHILLLSTSCRSLLNTKEAPFHSFWSLKAAGVAQF